MADVLPWIRAKHLSGVMGPRETARAIAASIAFTRAGDRELRKVHLETFEGADEEECIRAAALAYDRALDAARADLGDDPGFSDTLLRKLVKQLATDEQFRAFVIVYVVLRRELEVEVRRVVLERWDVLSDPADVMAAIAEAVERVAPMVPS